VIPNHHAQYAMGLVKS